MKRLLALVLAVLMLCSFAGCKGKTTKQNTPTTPPPPPTTGPLVGLCMPEAQWKTQAELLETALHKLGYRTQTEYADSDAEKQAQQVETMAQQALACLVVVPVDSMALATPLQLVRDAQIPVVAYDRLLTDTDCVDAYVGFDYEAIGQAMGDYIISKKALDKALEEGESYTVEFLMGSASDHSALLIHRGLMNALQPYLDAQVLECPSGRTAFVDTYVLQDSAAQAKEKCGDLLASVYKDTLPDILCAGSDRIAEGCVKAVSAVKDKETPWPLIAGQEGTGLQQINKGKQAVTLYKDYAALAETGAQVVDTLIRDQGLNTRETLDNYALDLPAILCQAQVVDEKNVDDYLKK